ERRPAAPSPSASRGPRPRTGRRGAGGTGRRDGLRPRHLLMNRPPKRGLLAPANKVSNVVIASSRRERSNPGPPACGSGSRRRLRLLAMTGVKGGSLPEVHPACEKALRDSFLFSLTTAGRPWAAGGRPRGGAVPPRGRR